MGYKLGSNRSKGNFAAFQKKGLISPLKQNGGPTKEQLQAEADKQAKQKLAKMEFDASGKKSAEATVTASTSRGTGTGYEEAYEKVDKTKYPTLESFIEDAESYHKSQDISATSRVEDEIKKEEKQKADIVPTDPVATYVEDPGVIIGYTGERIDGKLVRTPIYAPKPKRKAQKGGEGEHLDVETSDVSGVGELGQQTHDYEKPVVGETTASANIK